MKPHRRIIDLACGTGNSTLPWAQCGYESIGVDIAEEMLNVVREKARARGMTVHFFQQDLRSLHLPLQGEK
ncbi:MAG: class I SAM-dependent methyltransferase [Bacillota bacterium]